MTDREAATEAGLGQRAALILFGAVAGWALWALVDLWSVAGLDGRVFVAVFTLASVFFGVALALVGPLSMPRAGTVAGALALPLAGLMTWASFRFEQPAQFLDNGPAVLMAGLIVLLATPFLAVAARGTDRVTEYAALFDAAWTITVRFAAAWVFVGGFWLVILMSDALLELVGLDVIGAILRPDWARFTVSGAVLGLGLAVAYELRDYVSPHLLLRLFRLLLPVLLVVVSVFLAALVVRGLSDLFGEISSAATLMGVALAAITLISTALDRDDADGVRTPGMKAAARILALMLPVVAALAAWAVVLRVAQYGWTPDRVQAAVAAGVILVYGLAYAAAALRGRGWRRRIRQANVWMAMMALGVACLWLTPVLNPQRIAADDQAERFLSGRSELSQLPVWQMQHDWGRAGQAALARVEGASADPGLPALLAAARTEESFYQYTRAVAATRGADDRVALAELMPVRPNGALRLTPEIFADVPVYRVSEWLDGCRSGGALAGCVWLSGAFLPGIAAEDQAIILFALSETQAQAAHVVIRNGRIDRVREMYDIAGETWAAPGRSAIDDVLGGRLRPVDSGIRGLAVDGLMLVPGN